MKQIVYLVKQWSLQLHTSRHYSDIYNLFHIYITDRIIPTGVLLFITGCESTIHIH